MNDTLTLYELNRLVRLTLQTELEPSYWVEAELSEARLNANGHFYLELVQKAPDGDRLVARSRGVMWNSSYRLLAPAFERETGQRLHAGLKVRVQVTVTFHELYGHSLVVTDIDPTYTLGDLTRRRREILRRLEAEGILDDNRSLPLPRLLNRVAVISAAGAAGYGDFRNQLLSNEYGLRFHTRLFAAVMQGPQVEASVLSAFDAILAQVEAWDVVVLIRGGGATSDLADFDTYLLAAACAQFPLPVVVGIGHERDETVLDRVAHTRVKTPTAAAAFLVDHQRLVAEQLDQCRCRLTAAATGRLTAARRRIEHLSVRLSGSFAGMRREQTVRLETLSARLFRAQRQCLSTARRRLDTVEGRVAVAGRQVLPGVRHRLEALAVRLVHTATERLSRARFTLQLLEQRCQAVDPERLLRRGYSVTLHKGRPVLRASDLRAGDEIVTRLAEGEIHSIVQTDETI